MELLGANALFFQRHYPIGYFPCRTMTKVPSSLPPLGYIRFQGLHADICSIPGSCLWVGSIRVLLSSRLPSFRRTVPSEHGHMHMQIYSVVALVYEFPHIYVCVLISVRCGRLRHIARCVYACMDPSSQADRGGESHKLNDVNALSTLCRSEQWRHTETHAIPSRSPSPSFPRCRYLASLLTDCQPWPRRSSLSPVPWWWINRLII